MRGFLLRYRSPGASSIGGTIVNCFNRSSCAIALLFAVRRAFGNPARS
jgi:hypothetical protein